MVKTAENFAAGFFGVPEYLDQVSIELMVETSGVNNTGAPYETCPNSNIASRGSLGSTAASSFATDAFNGTVSRLQSYINGVEFDTTDVLAMLQLCSYETDALGYSAFCGVFTEEDFKNYEYYFDLNFYYNHVRSKRHHLRSHKRRPFRTLVDRQWARTEKRTQVEGGKRIEQDNFMRRIRIDGLVEWEVGRVAVEGGVHARVGRNDRRRWKWKFSHNRG